MSNQKDLNRLYRSRKGSIFGVCQGISDWRELPVGYIRLGLIIVCIITGFFPVGVLYIAAGLLLPLEPRGSERDYYERDKQGKKDYRRSSRREDPQETKGYRFRDIQDEFDALSSRINRMEEDVVDKEKDWEKRFNDDK